MGQLIHIILYEPLYNILIFFTWLIPGNSIIWAILILTLIIRFALLSQSLKSAFFMIKSLELQPKINQIRKQIKDPAAQQKATMELYKKEGHSPFGSCLPNLIQIPVIWILYSVFRNGLTTDGFKDLYSFVPRPESLNTTFIGIDLTQPNLWVMPIIAGLLQLGYSLMMQPKVDKSAEPDAMTMTSRQMVYMMPIITVIFCRLTPAALVVYWIATTIFFIGQQWYVNNKSKKPSDHPLSFWEKIRRGLTVPSPASHDISPEITEEINEAVAEVLPAKKDDKMMSMMKKRLDKAEKKAGVNIVVRNKK